MALHQRVVLVERPVGQATPDCFSVEETPLDDLAAGQVRVAVQYVSVDDGTRTMLRGEGFHQQVGLGDTVGAGGVGYIVESATDGWQVDQAVKGGLERQARMEGFAYFHFPDSLGDATDEPAGWVRDGSISVAEHVLGGIEQYPSALQFMFNGGNTGKLLVKIGADRSPFGTPQ